MKTAKYIIALAAAALVSCSGHEEKAPEGGEQHAEEGGEQEIVLHPEQARVFGLEVDSLVPGPFREVIQVSGQIVPMATDQAVVTARSAGVVTWANGIAAGARVSRGQAVASLSGRGISGGDANEMARVQLRAAQREVDRLAPLYKDGLVTGRDYNAALQALETARAAASGTSGSGSAATSPISGVIGQLLVGQGQYVEAGQPLATVSAATRLTLRADVPERYASFLPTVSGANFRTSASDTVIELSRLGGKMVSQAPDMAGAQGGYVPVYFTFEATPAAVSGAYADVYVLGQPRQDVLTVPWEAVTEQQGDFYAYIQHDEEGYYKRRVTLGASDGRLVEITSGLQPGDRVVTRGAAIVTMAEATAAPVEGHHHHH